VIAWIEEKIAEKRVAEEIDDASGLGETSRQESAARAKEAEEEEIDLDDDDFEEVEAIATGKKGD
jgi:hypothetical protein